MAKGTGWIITTSSDRPIADIAEDLKSAGLTVSQVNDQISSISGTGAAGLKSKLQKVKGVVDVSPDTPIDIGPPGSTDTW
jgi:hypothetical protein